MNKISINLCSTLPFETIKKYKNKVTVFCGLVSFGIFSLPAFAGGALNTSEPFGCTSDSYLFKSVDMSSPTFAETVNLTTGVASALNSGNSFNSTNINAIGYNIKDGYIWGYDRSTQEVVRVGTNFIVDKYSIAGLPTNAYHTGDVSPSGILFLAEQWVEGGKIYKVDVNPASTNYLKYIGEVALIPSTYSTFFNDKNIADFAFHPRDRRLYTIGKDGKLYRINPVTGLVTDLGATGLSLTKNPNAVWFDRDGYFYFIGNKTTVYKIDITDPASPNPTAVNFSALAFESQGDAARCSEAPISPPITPVNLSCPAGYQLETWPASSPGTTEFDSSNNLLRLTASTSFTDTTHPGIGGIYTSGSGGTVFETISISAIDPSVTDIKNLRVLAYDLDSETTSDQDYAFITFNGVNIAANSIGSNVEVHSTVSNGYQAKLNSGGGTGADNAYHAGFVVEGITDGSTITLTSGYTGAGTESFVGYQACIKTSPVPEVYTPQACGVPGFIETFGAGVGRSPMSTSARTDYSYDDGVTDTYNGPIVMDDQYTVLDKSTIPSAGAWWIIDDDHTGDANGRMLMVNADYYSGEFYRQSISGLTAGKEYSFAAHIANAEGNVQVRIPVNVKFSIESAGAEVAFVETGDILQDPGRDELAWTKYELKFIAPTTSVDIVLINNIGGGLGNDIVIDDISLSEVCAACSAFMGEVTEVALPLGAQLQTTDKLFVPSKDSATSEGHLKAYPVDANGTPSTTVSWDATGLLSDRISKLYSSDTSGDKVLFNSLDDGAFSSADAVTIKATTIAANLGGVSKGNNLDILTSNINTSLYLADNKYRDYYTATVSSRSQRVLMSSDDGFLYAFDYTSGALIWAWMPRSLVSELASGASFQTKHLMAGSVDILDLPDSSGNYSSYVVGSYKGGLGHYVLKLSASGDLSEVVWDDDQSGTFASSPNNGEMEYFRDGDGQVYASYALSNVSLTSVLKIRSLVDNTENNSVSLSYQVSSTPFVMQDYGKSNAPAKKTIYVGTAIGKIHSAVLLDTSGTLMSTTSIQASLQDSSVTEMDGSDTDPVLYIDASVSAKDNQYYLSSQTATRLTIHKYKSSTTSWNKAWTSYSSGAGNWNETGTWSEDTSGVPTDLGGFAIIPPSGIQSLPVDAEVTDKAIIVGDTVILPISVIDSSSTACYGKAYYYIYSLSDGIFPMGSVVTTAGIPVVTNIALGYGDARRVSITNLAGTNKLLAYGVADKKADLTSGIATTFVIKDPVAGGVRGWKEVGH